RIADGEVAQVGKFAALLGGRRFGGTEIPVLLALFRGLEQKLGAVERDQRDAWRAVQQCPRIELDLEVARREHVRFAAPGGVGDMDIVGDETGGVAPANSEAADMD